MKGMILALATGMLLVTGSGQATAQDKLRLGTEGAYPPFNETKPSGEVAGFDIDIGNALCAEMKVQCEWVAQAWEGIIPALKEKKFDAIIASMSINDERKQVVDFSGKYYESPAAWVAAKTSTIDTSMTGLKGKVIGVQIATVSACYLEDNFKNIATIKQYDTQENANLDLAAGRVDVVLADLFVLTDGFLNKPEGAAYEVKAKPFTDRKCMGEGIGIAVRKEDGALRERLNAAIKAIRANGVYQAINAKYFPFDIYGE
jgi:lysine-arginine-ornithine-binding protein